MENGKEWKDRSGQGEMWKTLDVCGKYMENMWIIFWAICKTCGKLLTLYRHAVKVKYLTLFDLIGSSMKCQGKMLDSPKNGNSEM